MNGFSLSEKLFPYSDKVFSIATQCDENVTDVAIYNQVIKAYSATSDLSKGIPITKLEDVSELLELIARSREIWRKFGKKSE